MYTPRIMFDVTFIYQQLMYTFFFLQANRFLPQIHFGVCLHYLQEILHCFCTILYKKL